VDSRKRIVKVFLYGTLFGFVVAGAIAYALWTQQPDTIITRNVYVDKRQPPKLRRAYLPPVTRYLYRRRVDTVTVRIPVPVDFGPIHGVLRPDWIRVGRRAVTVDYWSPDSLRYIRERFRYPERTWGLELTASVGYAAFAGFYSESELELRRRRWAGYVGYIISANDGRSLSFGVRRRVFSL